MKEQNYAMWSSFISLWQSIKWNNITKYNRIWKKFFSDRKIEDKINELKIELSKRKLQNDGQVHINLYRENLLNDTLKQTENVDFYKYRRGRFTPIFFQ